MNALTHRQRLIRLQPLLDQAPFDVEDLQEQLSQAHHLPDSDAKEVVRQTLNELTESAWSFVWSTWMTSTTKRSRPIDMRWTGSKLHARNLFRTASIRALLERSLDPV